MNATDQNPGTQSIVADYELPHDPDKVWRALTEQGLLARWLMANDFRPVVGHRFTFRTEPQPWFDGVIHCEVLAVEPGRLLSYTWRTGPAPAEPSGFSFNTTVTWTLTATAGGTRLHLEQTGFTKRDAFAHKGAAQGWPYMVQKLEQVLGQTA